MRVSVFFFFFISYLISLRVHKLPFPSLPSIDLCFTYSSLSFSYTSLHTEVITTFPSLTAKQCQRPSSIGRIRDFFGAYPTKKRGTEGPKRDQGGTWYRFSICFVFTYFIACLMECSFSPSCPLTYRLYLPTCPPTCLFRFFALLLCKILRTCSNNEKGGEKTLSAEHRGSK